MEFKTFGLSRQTFVTIIQTNRGITNLCEISYRIGIIIFNWSLQNDPEILLPISRFLVSLWKQNRIHCQTQMLIQMCTNSSRFIGKSQQHNFLTRFTLWILNVFLAGVILTNIQFHVEYSAQFCLKINILENILRRADCCGSCFMIWTVSVSTAKSLCRPAKY